jgi:phage terminase large subunit-like protein
VLGECESRFYLLQVWSDQVEAPAFARILKGLTIAWPGAPMLWYGAGPEKGIADYLNDEGVPLLFESATVDKFVRCQPVAGAWNRGDILIPGEDLERGIRTPEWVPDFMGVVLGFTGVKDLRDDEVDALAAAYDLLAGGMGVVQTSVRGERLMLNTGGF